MKEVYELMKKNSEQIPLRPSGRRNGLRNGPGRAGGWITTGKYGKN
jgi:hypothetical protein